MATPLDNARVEIAWDSGFSTLEGARTWTDATRDVVGDAGISITYGRADQQPSADPNTLTLTLRNDTGKYTPGNASSPYSPNVKKGKPIRVSVRYPSGQSGNLLTANQASMETSIADWATFGSVVPTLTWDGTHVANGTKALLITWGTGGSFPGAGTTVTGLVVGRTYTAQAQAWVPTGSPNPRLTAAGTFGATNATKNAFTSISVTFVATASSHVVQVQPGSGATAGQQCWVDSVMVDEGSTVGTFTTAAPPIYVRYTGYINEWPVVWPDGSDRSSLVTITAASRRARLGQTAPLATSAIREAYLSDNPYTYWPMDEIGVTDSSGRFVFRDITNQYLPGRKENSFIGLFAVSTSLIPLIDDGIPGPTDEGSLIHYRALTDTANPDWQHYVGGSNVTNVGSLSDGCVFEMVARVVAKAGGALSVDLARVFSSPDSWGDEFRFGLFDDGSDRGIYITLVRRDTTGATLETSSWGFATTHEDNQAAFDRAKDGEIHHYMIEVAGVGAATLFFDGVAIAGAGMGGSFANPFRTVAMVTRNLYADVWVGHAATYSIATSHLVPGDELLHAEAATAATESVPERVARIAARGGVPAAEVDSEATIASSLGREAEKGRAVTEILDEIATSTAGILYDTRTGHLAMQARNHRYNAASAFTLSTSGEEIEADLTAQTDDRYLVNYVEVNATASDDLPVIFKDQASIDDYGVYAKTFNVALTSLNETIGAAQDQLYRYAQTGSKPRISTVSVDLGDLLTTNPTVAAKVLAADVGTKFTLSGLPSQAPSSTMSLFLEGYTETIALGSHLMAMNTTPADAYQDAFVIGDATHGALDSTHVLVY